MNGRRVYVGGTFDLFHAGHVAFLRRAKQLGTHLIVGLNTDEFAARYKRAPIMSFDERRELLEGCRYVDEVVVNEGCEDSRPAIEKAGANVIVHGDDWTGEALMRQMGLTPGWLAAKRIELAYVPYTMGVSSSEILARVFDRKEES